MDLEFLAQQVAGRLQQLRRRIVLAESCTAGLVSATLATVPGISDWHCGSAVTYRNLTKCGWLGVSAADIEQHTAVSEPVAQQMALGVLAKTPEADCAASVTGHLGPGAPEGFDGLVFVAAAVRRPQPQCVGVWRVQLQSEGRLPRQQEAAAAVLSQIRDRLLTS